MPARKGDRPFVGMTNEARKSKASTRRDAILNYMRNLSERIPARALTAVFNVSLRTVMYDLDFLFKHGHAEELRPKFLESAHMIVAPIEIDDSVPPSENAKNSKTTVGNMRARFRGEHLLSGKIHYDNIACFSRGRLSFVEYQVINILKRNPGLGPKELYDIYSERCFNPARRADFSKALYRLVSLQRAFAKPISAKRYNYFAYHVSPKSLECGWSLPPAFADPPKHQSYFNITNYSSYRGKRAHMTVVFSNRTKGKLTPIKKFYVEFNKTCGCGGQITAHDGGVRYCDVCGLVEQSYYMPGIENVGGAAINHNTQFGMGSSALPRRRARVEEAGTPFDAY
jgi:hypothetical protein